MSHADTAGDTATLTIHVGDTAFEAVAWEWLTLSTPRPDAVVAACAGLGADPDSTVQVVLEGAALHVLPAHRRHGAGLGVVTGRLGGCRELRVLDIVLLGLRTPPPPLWQILLGTARARCRADDDQAEARALAGRTGLAAWVDRPAVNLPPDIVALVDLTRALAGAPKGLVWRRPEWLAAQAQAEIAAVLAAEQDARSLPVIEVATWGGR